MEWWKNIIELISSLIFLLGVIIGAFAFKYKYDANIRDLYIENCKELRKLLLRNSAQYCDENINKDCNYRRSIINEIKNILFHANLYLNNEVVEYIEKIKNLLEEHYKIYNTISGVKKTSDEKREQAIDRDKEILEKLENLYEKAPIIYRKHIVQSPIEKIQLWWQERNNFIALIIFCIIFLIIIVFP